LEQRVELRVGVVGRVLALGARAALRTVEQEEEVLRVGIVGVPDEAKELRRALADLLLEAVPVGGADLELQRKLLELLPVPVERRLVARAARHGVEVEHERLTGARVAAVRVARLREELLRGLERLPLRLVPDP